MNSYVIVGGGAAGLLAAALLKKRGIPFIGLEKTDSLGGRLGLGHHRFYSHDSVTFLSSLVDDLGLEEINAQASLREKGEWTDVEEGLAEEERFYLGNHFYQFQNGDRALVDKLVAQVGSDFCVRKEVLTIDTAAREIVCRDETRYPFENLIWCSPLELLSKVIKGASLPLAQLLKKSGELPSGFMLKLVTKESILPTENTVVFPFRFKEWKLRALGKARKVDEKGLHPMEWIVFVDEGVSEDREELAKCIRTLRRELEKDFPELATGTVGAQIVHLPIVSGEKPAPAESIEILPHVFSVGPQIYCGDEKADLRNLDLTFANCVALEKALGPKS